FRRQQGGPSTLASSPSPDLHALLRRAPHPVARAHAERLMELRQVHHHRVGAVLARAVRIGEQSPAQLVLAVLAGPALRPTDEEALLPREAVDDRRLAAVERQAPGAIGHGESGEIGDVLTHGQLAIHVQPRQRAQLAVLLAELLGATRKLLVVLGGPPIVQVAGAVIAATLIVEAVTDLVNEHLAGASVSHVV